MEFLFGSLFLFVVYAMFERLVRVKPLGPDVVVDSSHWESIDSSRELLDDPMFMSAESKREYLKSEDWERKHLIITFLKGYVCECCGSTHHLELHHIRYDNLGNEEVEDLMYLCRSCHQLMHDTLGYDRRTEYPLSAIKEQ